MTLNAVLQHLERPSRFVIPISEFNALREYRK